MFHPNIYEDGNICLDILQNMWSPMLNLTAILTSIQSLLTDPNTKSPANKIASDMFVNDRATYHRQVMRHVELSWGLDEIEKQVDEGNLIKEADIKSLDAKSSSMKTNDMEVDR